MVEDTADAIASALGALVKERKRLPVEATEYMLRARHMLTRDFGKVPEAIQLLEKAYAVAPDDPRVVANYLITQVRLAFFLPKENRGVIAETLYKVSPKDTNTLVLKTLAELGK